MLMFIHTCYAHAHAHAYTSHCLDPCLTMKIAMFVENPILRHSYPTSHPSFEPLIVLHAPLYATRESQNE
jgi:hypothetical protein